MHIQKIVEMYQSFKRNIHKVITLASIYKIKGVNSIMPFPLLRNSFHTKKETNSAYITTFRTLLYALKEGLQQVRLRKLISAD